MIEYYESKNFQENNDFFLTESPYSKLVKVCKENI